MQELQRILADKELKDALLAGTELFNQHAVKGGCCGSAAGSCGFAHDWAQRADTRTGTATFGCFMGSRQAARWHITLPAAPPMPPPHIPIRTGLRLLVQSGVIADGSPAAAAAFLRQHAGRLDKGQVGELLGHHDDHSIAVSLVPDRWLFCCWETQRWQVSGMCAITGA